MHLNPLSTPPHILAKHKNHSRRERGKKREKVKKKKMEGNRQETAINSSKQAQEIIERQL